MTDETNNPDAGTDNVELSENDTPELTDYFDPDEDQDTEEPEGDGTDDEADEADNPDEEPDQEADDPAKEKAQPDLDDDVTVKLADGTTRTLKELKDAPMFHADYTRKSQEVATQRNVVKADAQRISNLYHQLIDHVAPFLPDAPSDEMFYREPQKALVQQQIHDRAKAQLQRLIAAADEPQQITNGMSQADHQQMVQQERASLSQMFPETATQAGAKAFYERAKSGANELGFTDQEMAGESDHRMFALAHWAKIGMDAHKAKAKATAKAEKAPPATPRKPGQTGNAKSARNADAMRKLNRTGSLNDAMSIDFD